MKRQDWREPRAPDGRGLQGDQRHGRVADFLAPLLTAAPARAREVLAELTSWGVNRLSLDWRTVRSGGLLDRLDAWGYEYNVYDVPDLEGFLQAALLLPRSITSDFNFPRWRYYGRGSGERSRYYQYAFDGLRRAAAR